MSWQLIFTSAPRGIAAGQSGFCTVVHHPDMPGYLLQELERLSSYAHLAAPGSKDEEINPIVASHRIMETGDKRYHVLSRVQSAGVDFSRRSNHIAHHLVFEESDIADLPTPAHILWAWSGWRKQWDGDPRHLDTRDDPDFAQMERPLPLPARFWEEATTLSRNAVLLVDSKVRTKESCYVIVHLHHPLRSSSETGSPQTVRGEALLLRLFEESLLLKEDPKEQWSIPFTTFLQSTDNPADFVWRGWRKEIPLPSDAESGAAQLFDLTVPGKLPPCRNRKLIDLAQRVHLPPQPEHETPQVVSENVSAATLPAPPEEAVEEEKPHTRVTLTPREEDHRQYQETLPEETGEENAPPVKITLPPGEGERRRQQKPLPKPKKPEVAEAVSQGHGWLEPKRLLSALGVLAVLIVVALVIIKLPKQPAQSESPPMANSEKPSSPLADLDQQKKIESARSAEPPVTPPVSPAPVERPVTPAPPTNVTKPNDANTGKKPPQKPSPSPQPPVAQVKATQPTIYLAMDGDDIGELLKSHFGMNITRDILSTDCDLSVMSAGETLPPSSQPVPVTLMADNGKVYDLENALLFTLGAAGQLPLAIQAEKKNANWFIQFTPRSNTPLSQTKKPPFTLLLWTAKQAPLLRWNVNRLRFAGNQFVIEEEARTELKRLRLSGGTVRLETQFAMPGSKPQLVKSETVDVSSLDYGKLALTFTQFAQQSDNQLATLRQDRAKAWSEYSVATNAITYTQRMLTDDSTLNTLCPAILDNLVVTNKVTRWLFKDFWTRLPTQNKIGKDLPEWGDYCNYLTYVCGVYLEQRLGRPPRPEEKTKILNLFRNNTVCDPNLLSGLPERLHNAFRSEINSSPVKSYFRTREGVERYYEEEFKKEWEKVFKPETIRNQLWLLPQNKPTNHERRFQECEKKIQEIERLKQPPPKAPNELPTVSLVWQTMKGETITLVEFSRSGSASTTTPGRPAGASFVSSTNGSTR